MEQKRIQFDELSADVRVWAMLAVLPEPWTRESVYDYAEIDIDNLSESDRLLIESIMDWCQVHDTEVPKYKVPDVHAPSVFDSLGVDMSSVKDIFLDKIWIDAEASVPGLSDMLRLVRESGDQNRKKD